MNDVLLSLIVNAQKLLEAVENGANVLQVVAKQSENDDIVQLSEGISTASLIGKQSLLEVINFISKTNYLTNIFVKSGYDDQPISEEVQDLLKKSFGFVNVKDLAVDNAVAQVDTDSEAKNTDDSLDKKDLEHLDSSNEDANSVTNDSEASDISSVVDSEVSVDKDESVDSNSDSSNEETEEKEVEKQSSDKQSEEVEYKSDIFVKYKVDMQVFMLLISQLSTKYKYTVITDVSNGQLVLLLV